MRIVGNSMAPTLLHDDLVVVIRRSRADVDRIVIVDSDAVGYVVKRVNTISKKYLRLQGDNPRLSSSLCTSDILVTSLIGIVFFRLRNREFRMFGHSIVLRLGLHLV